MYLSIDKGRGIAAVRNALETKACNTPSTDYIVEGLEICLKRSNTRFGSQSLQEIGVPQQVYLNSCSYADLAVFDIEKNVLQAKRNT